MICSQSVLLQLGSLGRQWLHQHEEGCQWKKSEHVPDIGLGTLSGGDRSVDFVLLGTLVVVAFLFVITLLVRVHNFANLRFIVASMFIANMINIVNGNFRLAPAKKIGEQISKFTPRISKLSCQHNLRTKILSNKFD